MFDVRLILYINSRLLKRDFKLIIKLKRIISHEKILLLSHKIFLDLHEVLYGIFADFSLLASFGSKAFARLKQQARQIMKINYHENQRVCG